MLGVQILNKLYAVIGFIWLLFMLMFPSDFQEIKYVTLLALLSLIIFEILLVKKKLNRNLIAWIIIWLGYFLTSLLIGLNNGYTFFTFSLLNMFFITPIVALLLSNIISDKNKLFTLNKMLVYITLLICVLDLVYILDRIGVITLPFDLNTSIFGASAINSDKVEFRITNQSSLIFLLPYIMSLLMFNGFKSRNEKFLLLITIFLGIIVAILSGRRALQGIVVLAFVIIQVIIRLKKKKILINKINPVKSLTQMLIALILIFITYSWFSEVLGLEDLFQSVSNTFLSAFDISTSSGDTRVTQVSMLINEWKSSPIFGHGLNSYVEEYTRSSTTPWSYEMVYIAMLSQTGIVGVILFLFTVIFVIKKIYKRIKNDNSMESSCFLAILVGFICFIIAGATNPMVYYVWAWAFAIISYQNFDHNKECRNKI